VEEAWESGSGFAALFGVVVLIRFALPLLIFRYPLPGIIACLVVDAVDQTVFQWFGYDPPFYQHYDKAMDVFYLAIAYVAMLRNWLDPAALLIGRALFYWRQLGVAIFQYVDNPALLLIFANTFEYFFIAYEAVRCRWSRNRVRLGVWIGVAAAIWIVIKLPQEWWIHIAQRDFTDTVRDVAWFGPAVLVGLVILLVGFLVLVRPRLPAPDHPFRLAAPPLPAPMSTAAQRATWVAAHGRVRSRATLDKMILVGLLGVIFGTLLPGPQLGPIELFVLTAVVVVANAALSIRIVHRARVLETVAGAFAARLVINVGLVAILLVLFSAERPIADGLFLAFLASVILAAYDVVRPVYEYRRAHPSSAA
jgi:hypothetical protein